MSSESIFAFSSAEAPSRFRIVGIGASAGGLESLEQFFKNLPANPGMAFVVVQHLSPDFRSVMDELLARHSDLPIQQAEHNVEVQANHVYLLPPKKEIVIRNRRLLLSDKERTHGLTLPIDQFFRSLAQDVGPDAVGIILSGSGSDGSRGVCEIKRAGGQVFVETPETAKFDGMPMSAIATGIVDRSATASEIAKFLVEPSNPGPSPAPEADASFDETPLESILRRLRDQLGLDFSLYKTSTVSRRILRRVQLLGSVDLAEYSERLRVDPDELSSLYHDLLIGVTRFFRDPEAFEFLEQHVIPDILDRTPESEEIRVWVAGCATGEEAYSLTMLLFEQLTARGRQLNMKVLSTDVHTASLARASSGFYGEEQLEHVSEKRLERFFRKTSTGYQISQDLRQLIVFAPHNVIKDAPFTKMHLITCRNLLIYFEPPAQKTVLSLFHFGLSTNGYLFLGPSEMTGALSNEFDAVNEHWKIYRKRRDVRLLEPLRLTLTRKAAGSSKSFIGETRTALPDTHLLSIYDQLLDRHMPPSFLVNEDRQLIDSFGGAERMFHIGKRRPSTNVLDLLEGELRTVVAGAIQRALKKEGPVRYSGVPVTVGDSVLRCTLSAETFTNPRTNASSVLISVEHESSEDRRPPTDAREGLLTSAQASQETLHTLESELSYTRETLQSTIEELQTSNEELQAANEELVASNEELQSTNEELHSVNEELYTVNAELQHKIGELRELNADMQHFIESTELGTLFLDRNLCIRKYTPKIADVFHIQQQDAGRSIRHFSYNLKRPSLLEDVEHALTDGVVIEDEVRDGDGTTYFLRILPYRASAGAEAKDRPARGFVSGGNIEGVVISLTDITALERVRSRLRQMSAIVESSEDAIIGSTLDGMITTWNRGAERLFGYSAQEAIGRRLSMLAPPGCEDEIAAILDSIRRGERIEQSDTMHLRRDGTPMDMSGTISPVFDSDGRITGASTIARDMTLLRRAQREVADRESRIRLLLDSTAEGIIGLGSDGLCAFVNPACLRLLGYTSPDGPIGKHIHALIHGSGYVEQTHSEKDCPIYNVLFTGEGAHADAETLYRADGGAFVSEYWSYPIRRGSHTMGAVVTFLDVTDRRRAEEEIRTGARRRDEFLAMLSHELRNPLAAVVNAITVLRTPGVKPDAVDKARQIIERQSRHMSRLLDDLLDVSRITRGSFELHKEDIDLRDIIHASVEALTPVFEERRAQVTVDLPDADLPIRGDGTRIQQVVVNLLSNAARYSPAGSPISVSAAVEGDAVTLKVSDRGRGISPSMLSEIFELFVQDAQGLERSRGGLGIGLTLVRQIVELHGGSVRACSDGAGSGSEFIVNLPRQPHAIIQRRHESNSTTDALRILIVEDQEDSREMLRVLLESMGHIVLEESDGASAVTTLERQHPDVALIDIGLPVMSGYEVARRVRGSRLLDDVVLVALTGYGRETDIQNAKDAGFDAHVTKPADANVISGILARKAPRSQAS